MIVAPEVLNGSNLRVWQFGASRCVVLQSRQICKSFSQPHLLDTLFMFMLPVMSLLIKHEIELPLQGYQTLRDQSLKRLVKISVM